LIIKIETLDSSNKEEIDIVNKLTKLNTDSIKMKREKQRVFELKHKTGKSDDELDEEKNKPKEQDKEEQTDDGKKKKVYGTDKLLERMATMENTTILIGNIINIS